jgi:HEAT repeat protein
MIDASVVIKLILISALVQSDFSAVAKGLVSPELRVRMAAAEQLTAVADKVPDALADRAVYELVMAAIEAETDLVLRNVEAVTQGKPPLFEEEYGEHYAVVVGLANRLRNISGMSTTTRGRLLRALVLATYNDDSPFAKELSLEGERIVPFVLTAVTSVNEPTQWNGYGLIRYLFEAAEFGRTITPLSETSRQRLREAARRGLIDPAPGVRRRAIAAVVAAKDRTALPQLELMARSDPDDQYPGFSVRDRAAAAVAALRLLP